MQCNDVHLVSTMKGVHTTLSPQHQDSRKFPPEHAAKERRTTYPGDTVHCDNRPGTHSAPQGRSQKDGHTTCLGAKHATQSMLAAPCQDTSGPSGVTCLTWLHLDRLQQHPCSCCSTHG